MITTDEKLINYLNHLITICKDGQLGYETAARDVEAEELKSLFHGLSCSRKEFANELIYEVRRAGGDPEKEGGPLGALHRAWMDVKSALTTRNDKAILSACITGERAAAKAYEEVLERAYLPADTRNVVALQHIRVTEALKQIEGLYAGLAD